MRNAYHWMNNMMYNRRTGDRDVFQRTNSFFFPMRMIGMVLFTALVILVIYLLLRDRRAYRNSNRNGNEAMDILRTRFARSEINEEEFMKKKELLQRKAK